MPDFWSIVIGNAIVAVAYGLIGSGARSFEGKRVSIVLTLAGALTWLAACSIGPIYVLPEARAIVMALIAIAYALLTVLERIARSGYRPPRRPLYCAKLSLLRSSRTEHPEIADGSHGPSPIRVRPLAGISEAAE